jgi:hypothetical protein
MARALDVLRTAGRIIWLCSGIGLLVYVATRWVRLYRAADPLPLKPGDITYHPEPDTAGKSEADKTEALRRKLGGGL